jgi:hypothetical protein
MVVDAEYRAASPDGVRRFDKSGESPVVQGLAGRDASDFDRAAPNAGIGEQHLTQGARTESGQPASPTVQGRGRDQGSGEHPRSVAAQQLDLADPGPGIRPQRQDARFITSGAHPALTQHPHLESARANSPQAPGQRAGVEQPRRQAGGIIARLGSGRPAWRSDGRSARFGGQDRSSSASGVWRGSSLWHGSGAKTPPRESGDRHPERTGVRWSPRRNN